MVTQGILDLILSFITPIVEKLPDVSINLNSGYAAVVLEWVNAVMYFIPVDTALSIISLIFLTMIFRLVISILKTLWQILPLV